MASKTVAKAGKTVKFVIDVAVPAGDKVLVPSEFVRAGRGTDAQSVGLCCTLVDGLPCADDDAENFGCLFFGPGDAAVLDHPAVHDRSNLRAEMGWAVRAGEEPATLWPCRACLSCWLLRMGVRPSAGGAAMATFQGSGQCPTPSPPPLLPLQVKYLSEHIKNDNKTNNLGDRVKVELEGSTKVAISCKPGGKAYAKRYFKYLSKKYLKKNQLRDYLRVLAAPGASNKNTYEVRAAAAMAGRRGRAGAGAAGGGRCRGGRCWCAGAAAWVERLCVTERAPYSPSSPTRTSPTTHPLPAPPRAAKVL